MVLMSPLSLLYDPGLQFSFLATLGLIVGSPLVAGVLRWVRNEFTRDILASTVAAQMGVLPLLLYHTGNLSFVSMLANVLVLPVIPAAMALSALAALAALLPIPEAVLSFLSLPAYIALTYIIRVAEWSAALPFARAIVPAFPLWVTVIAYLVLGLGVIRATQSGAAFVPVAPSFKRA
jgi:competence protein ComEC